jgi:RNA polymerase sigma-70 factor (ECF subfamily)
MTEARRFEDAVMPWLDAGYNLARWLLRDDSAAEDVVQEASLRAFRYFHALRGNEARPWFLGIVRNACYRHIEQRQARREQSGFEGDVLECLSQEAGLSAPDPAAALEQGQRRARIDAAINALAPRLREVIVLREIEGLEYAEIAHVASVPIGTVMSRLSRARDRLRELLVQAGVRE